MRFTNGFGEGVYKLILWYEQDYTELFILADDVGEDLNLNDSLSYKRSKMLYTLMSHSFVAEVVKNYRLRKD